MPPEKLIGAGPVIDGVEVPDHTTATSPNSTAPTGSITRLPVIGAVNAPCLAPQVLSKRSELPVRTTGAFRGFTGDGRNTLVFVFIRRQSHRLKLSQFLAELFVSPDHCHATNSVKIIPGANSHAAVRAFSPLEFPQELLPSHTDNLVGFFACKADNRCNSQAANRIKMRSARICANSDDPKSETTRNDKHGHKIRPTLPISVSYTPCPSCDGSNSPDSEAIQKWKSLHTITVPPMTRDATTSD